MTPEFSRPFRIDTLGEGAREVAIEAGEAERAALATRFALAAIDALSAKASLTRKGETVLAAGELQAQVTQICVASGAPLPVHVSESFALRFVPTLGVEEQEEVELEASDCDVVEYVDGAIDLGEAVAETMALALDPFPRSPDADAILKAAGVVDEIQLGPFAALKALRDKL